MFLGSLLCSEILLYPFDTFRYVYFYIGKLLWSMVLSIMIMLVEDIVMFWNSIVHLNYTQVFLWSWCIRLFILELFSLWKNKVIFIEMYIFIILLIFYLLFNFHCIFIIMNSSKRCSKQKFNKNTHEPIAKAKNH